MKTAAWYLSRKLELLAVALCASLAATESQAEAALDHLFPVSGAIDEPYRAMLKRKLCVTSADYARLLETYGGDVGEAGVAIYSDRTSNTGVSLTYTKAGLNLGNDTWDANPQRVPEDQIKVTRVDLPFPKSTAQVISKVWKRMISQTRPMGYIKHPFVVLGGSLTIFSIDSGHSRVVEGILTPVIKGPKIAALDAIEISLIEYSEARPDDRSKMVRHIETEANALSTRLQK